MNVISFDNNKHKYFELSNYFPLSLTIKLRNNLTRKKEIITFNSVEQYYQSEKYNTNNELSQYYRNIIIKCNTPKKAHMIGKQRKYIYDWTINENSKMTVREVIDKYKGKVFKRSDWNKVRDKILMKGLKEKFKNNTMKNILLSTKNKVIVENSIGIWGMKNNKLGNALMKLRDEIKKRN